MKSTNLTPIKVGTPLLFIPSNDNPAHQYLSQSIGMIVEIDNESVYPFRCIFDDNDDDWYSNQSNFVSDMVNNFMRVLNGNSR